MPGPTTDEERRVRSYLVAQGAKLSPADIVDKVRAAMDELRQASEAVGDDRFHRRPAAEEWSAGEVMAHVVEAGRRVGAGITGILDGAAIGSPPDREPDVPKAASLGHAGWWAELSSDRDALFARVLAANPDAHLDRTIEISSFGALTWRSALLFLRLHDLDHVGQMKKIAAGLA